MWTSNLPEVKNHEEVTTVSYEVNFFGNYRCTLTNNRRNSMSIQKFNQRNLCNLIFYKLHVIILSGNETGFIGCYFMYLSTPASSCNYWYVKEICMRRCLVQLNIALIGRSLVSVIECRMRKTGEVPYAWLTCDRLYGYSKKPQVNRYNAKIRMRNCTSMCRWPGKGEWLWIVDVNVIRTQSIETPVKLEQHYFNKKILLNYFLDTEQTVLQYHVQICVFLVCYIG